ncbi:hypothetical protein AGMMS50267_06010 [Spirochaetia bacterium]|nr:hypothetical protein AGMMS50267_06010 [Spirochaetia bacterium]
MPVPQVSGVALIIIAIAGLAAGHLRNELVLTLLGAVLLAVLGYCFLAVLFLIVIHRKRARTLSARMVPDVLSAGKPGAILCSRGGTGRFFRLPGILIRYEIRLGTRDGRRLDHIFDPDTLDHNLSPYTAPKRGAYYGDRDRLLILDILGLFRAAFTLPQEPGSRLLALPGAADKPVTLSLRSGGAEQRTEPHFLRTHRLTAHRPYIPGDDPRRINWKLYGHAPSNELFVREGEPEPPPHSRLIILIDTQTDPALFSPEAGRRAADFLCENALALILEYAERGMDVSVGYVGEPDGDVSAADASNGAFRGISGGSCAGNSDGEGEFSTGRASDGAVRGISGGNAAELAAILAYPAAIPLSGPGELPITGDDRGVLVLALPRAEAENSALDRFLQKRGQKQETDVLFLYEETALGEAAGSCVRLYDRKAGVRAWQVRV